MKGIIIALAVLLTVCALVVINAVYVHRITGDLLHDLESLPKTPDPETTPPRIRAISAKLESHLMWLGLSMSYTALDRAQETLHALEIYASTGDAVSYEIYRSKLRDILDDMARTERLQGDNIF